jgi:hypothetical protein
LKSPMVERLDIVENCMPVMEAAAVFFPEEYDFVKRSPKGSLLVDDFRGYVRFAEDAYDIIAMDHSIQDPYQIGFFTIEFFEQLKRITRPGGVVMLLGKGLSWNTTRLSFKYIYRNTNHAVEPALRIGCLYLVQQEITGPAAEDYELVKDGLSAEEVVYSDEHVRRLADFKSLKAGTIH